MRQLLQCHIGMPFCGGPDTLTPQWGFEISIQTIGNTLHRYHQCTEIPHGANQLATSASHQHHQLVFLECGSRSPAFHSRDHLNKVGKLLLRATRKLLLALAGDIESNPGPKCDSCGYAIRSNQQATRVVCIADGCNAATHRCRESGISRYDPEPSWYCRYHRGDPPLPSVTPTVPSDPCDTCGCKFRSNQVRSKVDCNQQGCTAATHRCPLSGISRYTSYPF